MKIAVIGGTGNLGYGLALRFGNAGHLVIIGSRTAEKAVAAAAEANGHLGREAVQGLENGAAASAADLVIVAVPFEAQEATLAAIREAVQGKVVVDATVPLASGDPTRAEMPPEGSAAERAQRLLPGANVIAAFHHVGAKALTNLQKPIDTDVLVCGDNQEAKSVVMPLMEALGTRGIDCGPLRHAQALERITPLLIGLNIRYKKRHTGLKLTGL
jgi:NADPH-dependent F420 reductase